jgi:hypothetical protein
MVRKAASVVSSNNDEETTTVSSDVSKGAITWEGLEKAFFSLLFAISHDNEFGTFLSYLLLVIEDVQIFRFLFTPYELYKFLGIDTRFSVLLVADFGKFVLQDYERMIRWSCVAIGVIMLWAANIAFVYRGYQSGNFKFIWPIRTLRLMSNILPKVLFLPICEVLFATINCVKIAGLESDKCFNATHMPIVVLSVIALMIFIPFSLILALV